MGEIFEISEIENKILKISYKCMFLSLFLLSTLILFIIFFCLEVFCRIEILINPISIKRKTNFRMYFVRKRKYFKTKKKLVVRKNFRF